MFSRPLLALAFGSALTVGTAVAQPVRPQAPAPANPPAAPAPEGPDRTAATFGDWTLRCETLRPPSGTAVRSCEIAQTFADQRGQPVAQLVFGRPVRTEPMRAVFQVPLEIRTDQPARLLADPAAPAAEAASLPFRLCSAARGGCFAELELRDEALLRRLRGRGEAGGRVEFRDSAGREVQLPLSLRGFGQALEALAREAG